MDPTLVLNHAVSARRRDQNGQKLGRSHAAPISPRFDLSRARKRSPGLNHGVNPVPSRERNHGLSRDARVAQNLGMIGRSLKPTSPSGSLIRGAPKNRSFVSNLVPKPGRSLVRSRSRQLDQSHERSRGRSQKRGPSRNRGLPHALSRGRRRVKAVESRMEAAKARTGTRTKRTKNNSSNFA